MVVRQYVLCFVLIVMNMLLVEVFKEIDWVVVKYFVDQKQFVVMVVLVVVQSEKGWVLFEVMQFVVEYFEMLLVWVEEVVMFYNMYDIKLVGCFKLLVCMNLLCVLLGGECVVDYLKKKFGIGFNEIMVDGNFMLKEGECMGVCGDVLVMIVNNIYMCSFMSNEKFDVLIVDFQLKVLIIGVGK